MRTSHRRPSGAVGSVEGKKGCLAMPLSTVHGVLLFSGTSFRQLTVVLDRLCLALDRTAGLRCEAEQRNTGTE